MKWLKAIFGKTTQAAHRSEQNQARLEPTRAAPPEATTRAEQVGTKTVGELAAVGQWDKLRTIVGDFERFAPALGNLNATRRVDISGHQRSVVLVMLALTTGQPHFGDEVRMAKEALSNLVDIGGAGSLKAGDVLMTLFLTVCFFDDLAKSGTQRDDVDLCDMGALIDKLIGPFSSAPLEQLCRTHGVRIQQPPKPAVERDPLHAAPSSVLGNLVRTCSFQEAMQALGSIMLKARTCPDMSHTNVTVSLGPDCKVEAVSVLDYALKSIPNIPDNMRRGVADIAMQIRATGKAHVTATASLAALSVIIPAVTRNRQLSEAAGSLVDALFFSLPSSVRQ